MNISFDVLGKWIEEGKHSNASFLDPKPRTMVEENPKTLEVLEENYKKIKAGRDYRKEKKMVHEVNEQVLGAAIDSVLETIANDIWYFLRYVVQYPYDLKLSMTTSIVPFHEKIQEGDTSFYIHAWECAMVYAYEHEMPLFVEGIPGSEKTIVVAAILFHRRIKQFYDFMRPENLKYEIPEIPKIPVAFHSARDLAIFKATFETMVKTTIEKWSFMDAFLTRIAHYLKGSAVQETESPYLNLFGIEPCLYTYTTKVKNRVPIDTLVEKLEDGDPLFVFPINTTETQTFMLRNIIKNVAGTQKGQLHIKKHLIIGVTNIWTSLHPDYKGEVCNEGTITPFDEKIYSTDIGRMWHTINARMIWRYVGDIWDPTYFVDQDEVEKLNKLLRTEYIDYFINPYPEITEEK